MNEPIIKGLALDRNYIDYHCAIHYDNGSGYAHSPNLDLEHCKLVKESLKIIPSIICNDRHSSLQESLKIHIPLKNGCRWIRLGQYCSSYVPNTNIAYVWKSTKHMLLYEGNQTSQCCALNCVREIQNIDLSILKYSNQFIICPDHTFGHLYSDALVLVVNQNSDIYKYACNIGTTIKSAKR